MQTETIENAAGIAVIGMAGRFPGADNIEKFWENLAGGVESLIFHKTPPELRDDPDFVPVSAEINNPERFDASFFGYSPGEAARIDPQQRLSLECARHALEDAGYDPETYAGPIGVYSGSNWSPYLMQGSLHADLTGRDHWPTVFANGQDYLATRISYKLNLRGPALNVQTACSTTLVAVHLACQAIYNGEAEIALAGGVALNMGKFPGYFFHDDGVMSPDGHCRAFDVAARGVIASNGAGFVALKALDEALADGDNIQAVIRGSAINNDGSGKIGYTAPSVTGQAEVIAEALGMAEAEPESVTYIETHGTGTPMGDPVEIAALRRVFPAAPDQKPYCALASLKTNIGHTGAVAGVAGLIKATLALKNKQIPPSLNFNAPNPELQLETGPFFVNTALRDWESNGQPRRAGVSSFGIGGTNAHVVLEEAPAPDAHSTDAHSTDANLSEPQLLLLSAKTASALEKMSDNLKTHFENRPETNLAHAAFTLLVGRTAYPHRRMLVCNNLEDALVALGERRSEQTRVNRTEKENRPVVFMFPGQGSQYQDMGRGLYDSLPDFREIIDHCAQLLLPRLNADIRTILYPSAENREAAAKELQRMEVKQPVIFLVGYALAQLWMGRGVQPTALIGHSLGEYIAACLAGVFSLEDALELVCSRGRLMQNTPPGGMLAVTLPEAQAQTFCDDKLALAAVNSPVNCVISGDVESLGKLKQELDKRGVQYRDVKIERAPHSQLMAGMLDPFRLLLRNINLKEPAIPYISNLTGTWINPADARDPDYWVRQLQNTVRFSDGMRTLLAQSDYVFLETGPGRTLATLAGQQPEKPPAFTSLRHPQEQSADQSFFLNSLGRLWLAGQSITPPTLSEKQPRRISLPGYPFEGRSLWLPVEKTTGGQATGPFQTLSWKRSVPPTTANETDATWLLFLDETGLGAEIVRQLRERNATVSVVLPGENFVKTAANSYALNPDRAQDFSHLFAELEADGRTPRTILYLWSLSSGAANPPTAKSLARALTLFYRAPLFLGAAVGVRKDEKNTTIGFLSNGLYEVIGEEALAPEKALLLGPCRMLPHEHARLICRNVDLALSEPPGKDWAAMAEQMLAEFFAPSQDSTVAYRGKHRWVQYLENMPLPARSATKPALRKKGHYLLAGGLSATGLELAEQLARVCQARVTLLHNEDFPARKTWTTSEEIAQQETAVRQKIGKLLQIEAAGGEFRLLQADACDFVALNAAPGSDDFGEIHGLIQAGRFSDQQTDDPLTPDVLATPVLHELFLNKPLDFFAICSSNASFAEQPGAVAQCAASNFLDAFAFYRNRHDFARTLVFNRGETGIAEFAESFANLLAASVTQIIVQEPPAGVAFPPEAKRPDLDTTHTPPRNEPERILAGIWSVTLGIAGPGIHDNFFELGGDSLLAVTVISKAKREGLRFTSRMLFDNPTIAELTAVLSEKTADVAPETDSDELANVSQDLAPDDDELARALLEVDL